MFPKPIAFREGHPTSSDQWITPRPKQDKKCVKTLVLCIPCRGELKKAWTSDDISPWWWSSSQPWPLQLREQNPPSPSNQCWLKTLRQKYTFTVLKIKQQSQQTLIHPKATSNFIILFYLQLQYKLTPKTLIVNKQSDYLRFSSTSIVFPSSHFSPRISKKSQFQKQP